MNNTQTKENRLASSGSGVPAWRLVFIRELADLWIGGKALILLFIYALVLGFVTYVITSDGELGLIPLREMIFETLETVIEVCLFIGLIISADSLSGERERNTLESLLLTPSSRRQIVAGKFLAAITFWPAAFILAIPTLQLLSRGDEIFGLSVFWGAILGSVLVLTYVGLGMLVSFWSNTNKISYVVSLGIYILFLIPAEMPETDQTSSLLAQFLQWINPIAAVNHLLSTLLMTNINFSEMWVWLQVPVVFAILTLSVLFVYAAPRLRPEQGRSSKLWIRFRRALGLGISVL
jgi:ABC-2 type transport system permease protein